MANTVLVTGSTSFVASSLQKYLEYQGLKVYRGVRVLSADSDELEVLCDLEDLTSISLIHERYDFDVIIHLAAAVGWNGLTYEDMFISNVVATGVLGYVARQMGAQFVFASAALVHGKSCEVIDGSSKIKLDTDYARTKYEAENLLKSILPDACILRIGGVFGYPGPSHLGINKAIASAISGVPPVLHGNGENLRNYIFVDDLAKLIFDAVVRNLSGTYLVAGSDVQSVESMLQSICNELLHGAAFTREAESAQFRDQVIIPSPELLETRSFRSALSRIGRGKSK